MVTFTRILLASEHEEQGDRISRLLRELGFKDITTILNPQEGIQAIEQGPWDVMLLDLDFGGPDGGLGFAKSMEGSDLPIIYLTDRTDQEFIHATEESYLYGYVLKPVQKRELELVLHLSSYRLAQNKSLEEQVRQSVRNLANSEFRYYGLIHALPDAVLIVDRAGGRIIHHNEAARRMYQFMAGQLVQREFKSLLVDPNMDWGRELEQNAGERLFYHKKSTGEIFPVSMTRNSTDLDGVPVHLFIIRDVSAQKQLENEIRRRSLYDTVTSLPNRQLLEDRIAGSIERLRRNHQSGYTVLYVGIDNFTTINTVLGHKSGDLLLKEFGLHLTRQVHSADSVGRIEGDQFAILLDDVEHHSQSIQIVNHILSNLETPIQFGTDSTQITVSMGVFFGTTSVNGESALAHAHTAMLRAKQEGKNCFRVFDDTMVSQVRRRNILSLEMDSAMNDGQFFLEYQPIHRLSDGSVSGFEVLARWFHPERGLISPNEFIPLAEGTGKIIRLGSWILERSCQDAGTWIDQFSRKDHEDMTVSINISGIQFSNPGFLEVVDNVLANSRLSSSCFKIEITETEAMVDAVRSIEILHQLKNRGIRISIDDFGTGFSSLSYLQQFPVDTLKIDLSFIRRLEKNETNVKITETIINLAHTLGLDVVAEGVETYRQASILRELGCDYAQGWHFSKPLVAKDVPAYLQIDHAAFMEKEN